MVVNTVAVVRNTLTTAIQHRNGLSDKNSLEKSSSKEKHWPQIIALLTASLTSLSMGAFMGWPSPSIPIIISPKFPGDITMAQASYLTVLPSIAMALAAPIFAKLPDQIGRKPCLLVFTAGPQIAAWGLIAATTSIEWLYLSRVLSGIADGCVFGVLPMYIGEVASPKIRGTWGNTLPVCFLVGQFVVNAIGAFFSIKITALSLVTVPIVFLCIFTFMPESPYYLIMKGQDEEAKESLMWLRSGAKHNKLYPEFVDQEFNQLSNDVARQLTEPGRFKELFTIAWNRRALLACVAARISQQFSGFSAFSMYSDYLFAVAGGDVDATTSTLLFVGTNIVLSTVSAAQTDKLGRVKAMVTSCLICCISLASLSVFLFLKDHSTVNLSAILWFPIAGMMVYIFGMSVGLTFVPTLLLSELFSSSIKGKALCFMNIFYALCVASSAVMFEELMSNYGLYASFAFFAIFCLVNSVSSYFIIPNTSRKTLEEIQQQLKNKGSHGIPQQNMVNNATGIINQIS